ncbi:PKD domain-containing protein [Mucilaginibacter flavus]|uniref:PKD domain-containing protein n=1 Tax=Mucilaginibacter flavus TaxID=931504 RepID=UPI0025B574A7|nr:PKD domain-containing protein [Mucilaginibacter flavus]MDN3584250.1 PKD domain-containing protein [Mucilaginibacter flavus]
MKPITKLILFLLLLSINRSLAQISVPVDLQSGRPIINIPIYTATVGDISLPVSLHYTAGIPETQEYGSDNYALGIGWGLSAGGSIIRTVKGLPDDFQGTGADTRMGWLYGSGASAVNNFAIQSRTNCAGDAANYSTLSSFTNNNTDTEPDVFSFNFGGYSGQFVFNNNKVIQLLPYNDLNIQPTYASSGGAITSFTVTTPDGTQYLFAPTSIVTQKIVPTGIYKSVAYLRDQLIKYITSTTYTTEWSLTQVTSATGATITLSYGGTNNQGINLDYTTTISSPTDIFLANGAINTAYRRSLFTTQNSTEVKLLNGITTANYVLLLNYSWNPGVKVVPGGPNGVTNYPYIILSINNFQLNSKTGPLIKNINLYYAKVQGRTYLQSLNESNACLSTPFYQFEYSGTVLPATVFSSSVITPSAVLPVPSTDYFEQDYWGYYNANGAKKLVPNLYVYPNEPLQEKYRIEQIPNYQGTSYYATGGANRAANPAAVAAGSLSRITFPTGGNVKIDYESNQYFDSKANQTFNGGGIRVKTITMHDGISAASDIIKNYSYTGGALLNRPQFAFSVPVYQDSTAGALHTIDQYADPQTQAQYFMARSEYDLNPYTFDAPNVIYQSVKESQTGRGSTSYQFLQPATYAQLTSPEYAAPYQWQAVKSQYATTSNPSTSACMSQGTMMDGYYGFPFAPNPNYNFERGLLQSVKVYNETGQLLKEKDYQYTPVFQNATPNAIYGLAADYFTYSFTDSLTRAYAYSKYVLYSGVNKLQSVQKDITYDPGTNFTKSATVETDNFYTGANHLLLNNTTTSVSNDGTNFTIYKTRFKYPQDFTNTSTGGGADAMTAALQNLKNAFIHNTVIEKISSITKSGGSEQVTGAELVKYNTFTLNSVARPLPAQGLILKTNTPLTDFMESGVNASYQFGWDNRYKVTGNYLEFNKSSNAASVSDLQQNLSGIHYDHTGQFAVAAINGATANQVVYSGFDYQYQGQPFASELTTTADNPYAFVISTLSGVSMTNGRAGNAISVPSGFTFSKTGVNKGTAINYTFSCWVQSTSAGNLTVSLSDGSGHAVSRLVAYSNTSGSWVFCKLFLPVSTLNAAFNVSVVNSTAIYADDMLLYPSSAQVSLSNYDYLHMLKSSDTDPHGNTINYQYDTFGRPTITTDNNQNILKQLSYVYNISPMVSTFFNLPAQAYVNATINLSATVPACEAGTTTRTWNFGDGSSATGASVSHAYNTAGTYNVNLTVSNAQYQLSSTQQITINPNTPQPSFGLYACGAVLYNVCNSQVINYGYSSSGTVCGTSMPVGTNTFTAANFVGCSTGTFTFEMAYDYAPNNWLAVSSGSAPTASFTSHYTGSTPSSQSYTMRCTFTPNCGSGSPLVQTYHIGYIAPNCNN